MINLVIIAELTASLSGLFLLLLVIQRLGSERYFKAWFVMLLLFLLCNATSMALMLFRGILPQQLMIEGMGFLFLALLGACTWAAKPLLIETFNRRWMIITVLIVLLFFGILHTKVGLFRLLVDNENIIAITLTISGKSLLAFIIVGSMLFLGKFELLTQSLAWRYGKRGATVAVTLLLLILSLIVLSSVSLVYGRISNAFFVGSQFSCALFFVVLTSALRSVPVAKIEYDVSKIRLSQFLSSGALIYGGIYLIVFGVLVKLAMVLGGDWRRFVSFFAALGAVGFAFVLITGKSLRNRWTRFVERNLLAGTYDFRRELQNLTEVVSTATDRDKLLQVVCKAIADIFMTQRCCLLIENEEYDSFQVYCINENREFEINAEVLTLNKRQVAWLARLHQSFAVESLLHLNDEKEAGDNLKSFLMTGRYELGSVLFAAQHLLGVIFLGPKRVGEFYSEEDKQLIEVLTNAISISIHGTNLQQHLVESKQMESIYRLASFIMHDLRNAVSTLTLLTQNAKEHLEKKTFRVDFISALTRVSNEMQTLIHKLSSVKAGGEFQHYEQCNPAELIDGVLEDLQVANNVKLKLDISPLPLAFWDKDQIRVVLRNILMNGLEAMPSGGILKIQGKHDRSHIHISVNDTGVGMSQDFIRHRLFKPHQTTKSKGLGIGLYQSKEIVSAHDGRIQVRSQPEKGTNFEIILPCLPGKAALEKVHSPVPQRTLPLQGLNAQCSQLQAMVRV